MRMVLISVPVALVLLAPSLGVAQPPPASLDLALRINLDDLVRVEDASGASATGRLTRLAVDEIAVQTDSGEKRFATNAIRKVAVRGYALRKGAIVGAVVFAVLGVVATCSHEGGGACAVIGSAGAAPIGAGVGLAAGALVPRMRTVYPAPKRAASVSPPPTAGGAVGASPLENLARRVNLDDQLEVEDRFGVRTIGRLIRLTADEITIKTSAGERQLTREAVRQVAVRRRPLRAAVLIGAAGGAAIGVVAACTGANREECADAPIMAGGAGAGLGLALGALLHRSTIVYPEPKTQVLVSPVAARGAVGVRASLRW